jgi:protein phosphatase-4 regulatory subunit 3
MKHRKYLEQNAKFKEVIPFNDAGIVAKIHQTFRLQFVKDVVLARIVDDATCATLNSLIIFNQMEIISHVQNDDAFQIALFQKLGNSTAGSEDRHDTLSLLQELLNLSKNLQPAARLQFFRDLKSRGLFDWLHLTLCDQDVQSRLAS